VPPDDFLPRLRALTREHGILLVADEIQSGMGRTGRMFALEHSGVEADIVTLAKGIASGMPLGAIVAGRGIMSWPSGSHGSTFGGNPVACAAALATLDLLEEGLVDNADLVGSLLSSRLRDLWRRFPHVITDVRGRGLMLAFECTSHDMAAEVIRRAFELGLLLLPTGRQSVRLSPALTLTGDEVRVGVGILEHVLARIEPES